MVASALYIVLSNLKLFSHSVKEISDSAIILCLKLLFVVEKKEGIFFIFSCYPLLEGLAFFLFGGTQPI